MAEPRLPPQVMLDIIYVCDVPTLKLLRIVHRSFRDLIDTYQTSIYANATRRLFDKSDVELFRPTDRSLSPLLALFALEYRLRMSKWLAAVGMENFQEDLNLLRPGVFGNIGANEAQGDLARDYVAAGWGVSWALADIAKIEIHKRINADQNNIKRRVSSLTRGMHSFKELETKIKKQQLEFIANLPFRGREAYGYSVMHGTITCVFRDRVFEDPRGKASDWRAGNEHACNNSWLNWLSLREGPDFFIKAWTSKAGNEACSKHITSEWSKRSKEQLLFELAVAKEVEDALLVASNNRHESRRYWDMIGWAESGRKFERVHIGIEYHLGRRLPRAIIRSIEQDYSDYSS